MLLDTNVLINAALLPQSFAAHALRLAMEQRTYRFLVTAGVMREVRKNLCDYAPDSARARLAEIRVTEYTDWLDAQMTDDDDSSAAPAGIQEKDRHIFHAASRHGAIVMTTDAPLWAGLRECGVPGLLPLEWIRRLDGLALGNTVFGVAPTAEAGSLVARAYPGSWSGSQQGKFTVVSFPGGFWIYYDAERSCWVAKVNGLKKPLERKAKIIDSSLQTVCLSWNVNKKDPKVQFRVSGDQYPAEQTLAGPIDFRPSGYPTIGSWCGVDHFWNGAIYLCISNDQPVSNDAWKTYRKSQDLAPNPYDADRVAAAIAAL